MGYLPGLTHSLHQPFTMVRAFIYLLTIYLFYLFVYELLPDSFPNISLSSPSSTESLSFFMYYLHCVQNSLPFQNILL